MQVKIGEKIANSFENVSQFRYWGTAVTTQNSIWDEIKKIEFW
jgi:hypothetical protein